MLSEMQHRVKNNFQMILAMIELQSRDAASQKARDVLLKLADNVMAMALAHNQLSPTDGEETINLGAYLEALSSSIEKPIDGIVLEIRANEMDIGIDQAVPIGLIVNEAVTNAVKHAYGAEGGKIQVELRNHGHGEALLSICDDGKGMEQGAQTETRPGRSGQKLIEALARQIRGRVELESAPGQGTTVRVIFPRPAVAAAAGGE
jgi:two-component sensor histidine kinase